MRLIRTDRWDDATRGEWEDIKRWGRGLVFGSCIALAFVLTRLVTNSYVEQLGIAVGAGAIVGLVGGSVRKRRSRVNSTETHSDAST